MELIINKSQDTPFINFNISKKIFEIGGKSLPEDAEEFYSPILNWLRSKNIASNSELHIKMEYFNTASSKRILDIISIFKEINENGKEILIKWFYSKEDSDMLSAAEEIEEILEFNIIKIPV